MLLVDPLEPLSWLANMPLLFPSLLFAAAAEAAAADAALAAAFRGPEIAAETETGFLNEDDASDLKSGTKSHPLDREALLAADV